MRRTFIIVGLAVTAIAGAVGIQLAHERQEYRYPGTRLMADLGRPDALIRTSNLSKLPRDLLKVPIARDVLTAELAFYYEQNEDRLGLEGAVKRIVYEHKLQWSDRLLVSVFNEPAEVAFWRDGKGALRHFALVIKRNSLSRVLQQVATTTLKDAQLKQAGELDTNAGKVKMYALELHPRRTLLIAAQGERVVVLSDPGLMFDQGGKVVDSSRAAVMQWLQSEGTLSRQFALDGDKQDIKARPTHTLAIGSSAMALGYGSFVPGFRGLRFDYKDSWSTAAWIEPKLLPGGKLGEGTLWQAAPANPSACVVLPVDWRTSEQVFNHADKKPQIAGTTSLLDGPALACWYGESTLYAPVFIGRFSRDVKDRKAALQTIAQWALSGSGAIDNTATPVGQSITDALVWRSTLAPAKKKSRSDHPQIDKPSVATRNGYVVFSPDKALVDLVLDTLVRKNPSVADQMPASDATVALLTPKKLATMAETEMKSALSRDSEASLREAVDTHLPARMRALAKYPPYRLELTAPAKQESGWQRVEWRAPEGKK